MGMSVSAMLYHIEMWWKSIPRFMHLDLQDVMFPPERQLHRQRQRQMQIEIIKKKFGDVQNNQLQIQQSEPMDLMNEKRPPYSKEIPPFFARCDKCHAKMYFVSQLGQIVQEHVQPSIKITEERVSKQKTVIVQSKIQNQPAIKKARH